MRLLLFFIEHSRGNRAYRLFTLLVGVAGVIGGVSNTLLLSLINAAVGLNGQPPARQVWLYAGLCLAMLTSRLLSELCLIRLTNTALKNVRASLCRDVLASDLRSIEEIGGPRIVGALTDDIRVIATTLGYVPILCMHMAVVISCLVYLSLISWPMFLLLLLFITLGIVTYQIPMRKAVRHIAQSRDEWDRLFKYFRLLTDGIKELKLHRSRQRAFLEEWIEPAIEQQTEHNRRGSMIYALALGWGQVLFFILIGLVLFLPRSLSQIPPEAITAYVLVILYLIGPLENILNTLPTLSQATVALKKIDGLGLSLRAADAPANQPADQALPSPWQRIELREISHTYYSEHKDRAFSLGPLSLSFQPGELVFLVGSNGSGKTTLAKVLTGLYPPESGQILVDGRCVTAANRDEYRQLFSAVFADFHLFEAFLGLAGGLDEQARDYLIQLQLDHKVQIRDGRLSTLALSQGQRKRLALLTAYLEDRSFYLFDEWAADQDPVFREFFYCRLLPALKERGKTLFVISHDDRYFHVADRVIRLDSGSVSGPALAGEAWHAAAWPQNSADPMRGIPHA